VTLTKKEQTIHEQGLVSVLRQIQDDLDAADAYGWPADLSDEEIPARLVALNHQRAAEERRGLVRWLRPEFQNPSGTKQTAIAVETEVVRGSPDPARGKSKPAKRPWPKTLSEQAGAVVLMQLATAATATEVASTSAGQLVSASTASKKSWKRWPP
jgi:hypothetical protein